MRRLRLFPEVVGYSVNLFGYSHTDHATGESHSALILLYRAVELPDKASLEAEEKALEAGKA